MTTTYSMEARQNEHFDRHGKFVVRSNWQLVVHGPTLCSSRSQSTPWQHVKNGKMLFYLNCSDAAIAANVEVNPTTEGLEVA